MRSADVLNFLSKITFRKACNGLKVFTSYYISKFTGKPVQWGAPFTISVEPTTNCNLGCPECPSGLKSFTRPTGNIDLSLFEKILHYFSKDALYFYFYFQGEPFIHPRFLEMVKMASSKGIYTVTSTNAHYLNERKAMETVKSGLDRIIVSIDGTTQVVYEKYRVGGNLEKVKRGTQNLVRARRELKSKTPHIILQFLVVKPNEHQVDEVKQLGRALGVDEVVFKTAQIYDYEHGNPLIPDNKMFSRYEQESTGKYKLKNPLHNHCWKLWQSTVITWDGKVVPCCFDKDAEHQMGNISMQNFKQIWQGDSYKSFRKNILKSRSSINICTNCSEGLKVWS